MQTEEAKAVLERTLLRTVEIDGIVTDVLIECRETSDGWREHCPKDLYRTTLIIAPRDDRCRPSTINTYSEAPLTTTEGLAVEVSQAWKVGVSGHREFWPAEVHSKIV